MQNLLDNINEIHLVGYGGLGKEIEFLLNSKFPNIHIIPYDDSIEENGIKKIDYLLNTKNPIFCIIAIGNPLAREKTFNILNNNKHIQFPNVFFTNFDSYNFSKKNIIGVGNIIMPQSIIGFNTIIGNFNLLGVNSGLGHDVAIGNFNFIGPNCFLAGNVKVGNNCKLSFGTFILQKISIVSNVNTMPYTSIYKNIKTEGTYHGNPAKYI